MVEKNIYLLRHGQIENPDKKKRFIGQVDVPLSEEGKINYESLSNFFLNKQIKEVYSSDLKRSRESAQIIASKLNLKVNEINIFREVSMGLWDGKTFEEIKNSYPEAFASRANDIYNFKPPFGESFLEVENRVLPVFLELAKKSQGDVIIVGHAGLNRVLIKNILDFPEKNIFLINQDYCCINNFNYLNSKLTIKTLNNTIIGG